MVGRRSVGHGDAAVGCDDDRHDGPGRDGWPALHAELTRVDAATAARLSPNDAQRIQRALEVHALTGRALSSLQGAREDARELGPSVLIALAPSERPMLHAAIARRFDAMLANGLIEEVRALRERYLLTPGMPSMLAS